MAGPARILIVDDDANVRELVGELLRATGLDVITAVDGAAGLAAVEAQTPNLILLDLTMPVMDGWTFLECLRRRDPHIPVVVVSAVSDAAIGLGVPVLRKPFGLAELLSMVQRSLSAGE